MKTLSKKIVGPLAITLMVASSSAMACGEIGKLFGCKGVVKDIDDAVGKEVCLAGKAAALALCEGEPTCTAVVLTKYKC